MKSWISFRSMLIFTFIYFMLKWLPFMAKHSMSLTLENLKLCDVYSLTIFVEMKYWRMDMGWQVSFICFSSALIKSTGLRSDGRIDDRSFWITYVSSVSIPLAVPFVYPRMVAIHDLDSKVLFMSSLLYVW